MQSKTNIDLLAAVAKRLGKLLSEVVFVGGCTTELFISDRGAAEIRPTFDVDAITEITSYATYADFCNRLRELGFEEDRSPGAPLCRWMVDGNKLDVMPIDERILGFSNRWYRPAFETAREIEIVSGLRIRVVTAPYFIATKLEAFRGRGRFDYAGSRDLEDLITVLDGRESIVEDVQREEALRGYVAQEMKKLLSTEDFRNALPGHLLPDAGSQERLPFIIDRMERLAVL